MKKLVSRLLGRDPLLRRIAANSGWLAGGGTAAKAFKVVESVIAARLLGVEQFGLLALVVALTATVNQFVDSRVWETAIKFIARFQERDEPHKATATTKLCYLIDALTAAVVFALLFLLADFAAGAFAKKPEIGSLIQLYAVSVLVNIPSGTASALLRLGDRFDLLALQKLVMAAASLLGVAAVALLGGGLRGVLLAYLVSAALGAGLLLRWSRASARDLGQLGWRRAPLSGLRGEFGRILRFAAYSNLGATSRLITKRADILILGWLGQPSAVGLYKLARSLADPLAVVFNPIYTAVYPELARLASAAKFAKMHRLQHMLALKITTLIVPAGFVVTLAAGWVIPLVFGRQYEGAELLTQIMVWQIIWTPLIWFPGYMLAVGKERGLAVLNWVDSLVFVVLLLILVPRFQAPGAATATLMRFVVWTVMAFTTYRRVAGNLEPVEAST